MNFNQKFHIGLLIIVMSFLGMSIWNNAIEYSKDGQDRTGAMVFATLVGWGTITGSILSYKNTEDTTD